MTDLKALSDAATQGEWHQGCNADHPHWNGSPTSDHRIWPDPFGVGALIMEAGPRLHKGRSKRASDDAAFIAALVNAYRAGTIGDTAAAYERGLREAAEVAGVLRDIAPNIEAAILAKLEKTDD